MVLFEHPFSWMLKTLSFHDIDKSQHTQLSFITFKHNLTFGKLMTTTKTRFSRILQRSFEISSFQKSDQSQAILTK